MLVNTDLICIPKVLSHRYPVLSLMLKNGSFDVTSVARILNQRLHNKVELNIP